MRPKKPLFSTETSVTFQANISPQTFNAKVHSLISIHRSVWAILSLLHSLQQVWLALYGILHLKATFQIQV